MTPYASATLISAIDLIATALDASQDSWRNHLQTVRNITATLDFGDTIQDTSRKTWQLPLIAVFQQVAYADVDNGGSGILDIANWCLRQSLTLLQVYPEDSTLLALIGQNWLLQAQKPLANIHQAEWSSTSSTESLHWPPSSGGVQNQESRGVPEAEYLLHTANYVEARGLLLPAIEYLKRAVDAAEAQEKADGPLLAKAAEAYMSLGNVSSIRVNAPYYQQALSYLQTASQIAGYTLPAHLKHYLDEYGPLMLN